MIIIINFLEIFKVFAEIQCQYRRDFHFWLFFGDILCSSVASCSSIIKGVGIIVGSHYNCGGLMSQVKCALGSPPINQSIALTNKWSNNLIDNIAFMNNQRVYMISGTNDKTVTTSAMNQLYKYLVTEGKYVPESNVSTNMICSQTIHFRQTSIVLKILNVPWKRTHI